MAACEQTCLCGLSGKVKSEKYPQKINGRTEQIEGKQVNFDQTWKSV